MSESILNKGGESEEVRKFREIEYELRVFIEDDLREAVSHVYVLIPLILRHKSFHSGKPANTDINRSYTVCGVGPTELLIKLKICFLKSLNWHQISQR